MTLYYMQRSSVDSNELILILTSFYGWSSESLSKTQLTYGLKCQKFESYFLGGGVERSLRVALGSDNVATKQVNIGSDAVDLYNGIILATWSTESVHNSGVRQK